MTSRIQKFATIVKSTLIRAYWDSNYLNPEEKKQVDHYHREILHMHGYSSFRESETGDQLKNIVTSINNLSILNRLHEGASIYEERFAALFKKIGIDDHPATQAHIRKIVMPLTKSAQFSLQDLEEMADDVMSRIDALLKTNYAKKMQQLNQQMPEELFYQLMKQHLTADIWSGHFHPEEVKDRLTLREKEFAYHSLPYKRQLEIRMQKKAKTRADRVLEKGVKPDFGPLKTAAPKPEKPRPARKKARDYHTELKTLLKHATDEYQNFLNQSEAAMSELNVHRGNLADLNNTNDAEIITALLEQYDRFCAVVERRVKQNKRANLYPDYIQDTANALRTHHEAPIKFNEKAKPKYRAENDDLSAYQKPEHAEMVTQIIDMRAQALMAETQYHQHAIEIRITKQQISMVNKQKKQIRQMVTSLQQFQRNIHAETGQYLTLKIR